MLKMRACNLSFATRERLNGCTPRQRPETFPFLSLHGGSVERMPTAVAGTDGVLGLLRTSKFTLISNGGQSRADFSTFSLFIPNAKVLCIKIDCLGGV